jgi:hypothetical protein
MSIAWTNPDVWHAVGTATTGTEMTLPTGVGGLYGGNVSGFGVFIDAGAGNTIAGGTFEWFVRNGATGIWAACDDLKITNSATAVRSRYFIVTSAGPGLPMIDRESYYICVPNGVTAAAGLIVYLNGTPGGRAP